MQNEEYKMSDEIKQIVEDIELKELLDSDIVYTRMVRKKNTLDQKQKMSVKNSTNILGNIDRKIVISIGNICENI